MLKLFFSYSHKDEALRDELETHLAMLKREGTISTWHDRRIGAGEELDSAISEEIEAAQIILLLVSPDFLASDYCYDREMQRAMEKHEERSARVIPVILRACDWHGAPFGKLMAVPADGKPVRKHADQDEAFLDIVRAVREAARQFNAHDDGGASMSKDAGAEGRDVQAARGAQISAADTAGPRSSNLRIRKEFSEQDYDEFLDEAFGYIANFFENSLAELERRNQGIRTRFRRVSANRFTAAVYANGRAEARCTIWHAGRDSLAGGIAYVEGETESTSTMNDSLQADDDGHTVCLSPTMDMTGRRDRRLTMQGGAEYLWEKFIGRMQ